MVNWVEVQRPILEGAAKLAGLRQQTVELDPGTTLTIWAPKAKSKTSNSKEQVVPVSGEPKQSKKSKKKKKSREKPAVVLVHGFAAEGVTTWQFQIGALTSKYSVYVPDLLFFGKSTTGGKDRSPDFQAECLIKALVKLGVGRCTVVGFSYGGMVAFKMAEARPDLVKALVVSGSVIAMTDSISEASLARLGFSSSSELLLPESVKGLKALLSVATYRKFWFPDFIHRDYLKVMFGNRKERAELLEGLVISNKDATVPILQQRVLLLWGENDNIFNLELAQNMLAQLGERAALRGIKKAGHLVQLERPCVYNRRLKEFLALVNAEDERGNDDDDNK